MGRKLAGCLLIVFAVGVFGCGCTGGVAWLVWPASECVDCHPAPVPVAPVKPDPKPEPKPSPPKCPNCPRFGDLPRMGFEQIQLGGPELDGVSIACDLPPERHIRNVGGSDGAGLCVDASVTHSADFHGLKQMLDFFNWCKKRPGGSYPEKLRQYITEYCKEKGVPEPEYIQITDGNVDFLEKASDGRIFLGTTYAGADGVLYRQPIAHMISLAYFSRKTKRAAILDNNNPGKILWMSDEEFVKRWLDMKGGWAFAWMAPPPPPVPTLENP